MTTFPDIYLKFEDGMLAEVHCAHCDERLGRIEMLTDATTGTASLVREQEIEGELHLLVDEHRDACPGESESV